MTNTAPSSSRRGLATASIVVGAVATLMIIGYWTIGGATDGQGLSTGSVLAVFFFYASVVVGIVAIVLGIVAALRSRPRYLGIVGIILGLVPAVAVAVATAAQAR